MLYVGSHRKENGVDYFGVTDTDDMVTEMVTKAQLWNIVNKQGIRIEGVVDNKIVLLAPIFDDQGIVIGIEPKSSRKNALDSETIEARKQRVLAELKEFSLSSNGPSAERFVFDSTYTKLIDYKPSYEETVIRIPSVRVIGRKCFTKLSDCAGLSLFNNSSDESSYQYRRTWEGVKFILPSSVEVVEDYAFAYINFTSDSELHTENIKSIGKYAFFEANIGGFNLSFPNIESIGEAAFAGDLWLEDDVLRDLGMDLQHHKSNLYEFDGRAKFYSLAFGNKLRVVPKYMCYGCIGMTDVVLGDSVEVIEENAFTLGWAIKSFRLPSRVREIGREALADVYRVSSLVLPDTLEVIGERAFVFINFGFLDDDDTFIPSDLVIPASVKSIGAGAFKKNLAVQSCKVLAKGLKIGNSVFEGCTNLKGIQYL